MNPLFLLILAHFLADFPFQPKGLALRKLHHFDGVVLHGLVHFITSAALLFPFWGEKNIWMGIAVIALWHILIDQTKITLSRKTKTNPAFMFLVDQALHLGMIALVGFYVMGPRGIYPIGQEILWYALILTLSTYTYDIMRWTFRKNPLPYSRDYKMMVRNTLIVTVAFGIYWLTK